LSREVRTWTRAGGRWNNGAERGDRLRPQQRAARSAISKK
jgi:hypothetical protein